MSLTLQPKTQVSATEATKASQKQRPKPPLRGGLWLPGLCLLVVAGLVGLYLLTTPPGLYSLPARKTLVEAGITFVQETLRAPATNPAFPTAAILVAFVLGGLHALTPGHNKLLTGVYLVGARAKFRHAILIGGAAAFSHTASVIVIGILASSGPGQIIASYYLRWLGVPSGLLVVGLGVWLLVRQLRGETTANFHGHSHDHPHDHNHPHGHFAVASQVTLGGLVVLGLIHGIVPTTDALAVLLVALSVKQILLGLALILAYSLGIASVLAAIGMLFLSSQSLLDRFSRLAALSRWAPAVAAAMVILLGLSLIARTLGM